MSEKAKINWNIKGVWYEACAAEGHCSMYFGRDLETPCKSFQLFQINEGKIHDVDISGTLVIQVIDLFSPEAADLLVKGGEGGIYISNSTTDEQRKYLEPFFINNVPSMLLLRKSLGVKYVDINLIQENNTFHVTMPYGEMRLSFTLGYDGGPQRLENSLFNAFITDIKICNTQFWNYNDFGKNWKFVNRSGASANFDLKGKIRLSSYFK